MKGTIEINEKRKSVNIGGITVFTYEGAKKAFETFAARALNWDKYGAEGIYALADERWKMLDLGFSPEELDELENEAEYLVEKGA